MMCSLARLDNDTIEAVKSLEKDIGKTILAYSCGEANPAALQDEELNKIKEVETKLGLALVAVG